MKFCRVGGRSPSAAPLLDYLRFLQHNQGIRFQIGHVDGFSLAYDGRMFFTHQPSDVRKEKSPVGVVGVGVGVAVLVMLSVVSHPNVHAILKSNKHQFEM